eukprot:763325-Hanusia_phi.AAC.1
MPWAGAGAGAARTPELLLPLLLLLPLPLLLLLLLLLPPLLPAPATCYLLPATCCSRPSHSHQRVSPSILISDPQQTHPISL